MEQDIPEQDETELVRLRKMHIIRMGAASAIKQEWHPVIEETVHRLSWTMALASRFLNFMINSVMEGGIGGIKFSIYDVPFKSLFHNQHLAKAVMWDSNVEFAPIVEFYRIIWLYSLIQKRDRTCFGSYHLDLKQLWDELQSKTIDIPIRKRIKAYFKANPDVLPSCTDLGNAISHAVNQYETSFYLYHWIGLQAHFTWYLAHKYDISKKVAKKWVEDNWPEKPKRLAVDQQESLTEDMDLDEDDQNEEKQNNIAAADSQTEKERIKKAVDSKDYVRELIIVHHEILTYLHQNKAKTFTLVPLSRLSRKFMRFDQKAVNYMLNNPK